jgi:hypothetical protein
MITSVLKILAFITTSGPTILKVLEAIIEAARLFTKPEAKQIYAMGELKVKLPKLSEEQIYNWIKVVLYLARLVGMKV